MAGNRRTIVILCCGLALALVAIFTRAEETGAGCLDCHAEDDAPIHAIANTAHGALAGGVPKAVPPVTAPALRMTADRKRTRPM